MTADMLGLALLAAIFAAGALAGNRLGALQTQNRLDACGQGFYDAMGALNYCLETWPCPTLDLSPLLGPEAIGPYAVPCFKVPLPSDIPKEQTSLDTWQRPVGAFWYAQQRPNEPVQRYITATLEAAGTELDEQAAGALSTAVVSLIPATYADLLPLNADLR